MDYKKKFNKYFENKKQLHIISKNYDVEFFIEKGNEFVTLFENYKEKSYIFSLNNDFLWNKIKNLRLKEILNNDFLENINLEYKESILKEFYKNYSIDKFRELTKIFDSQEIIKKIDENKLSKENYKEIYSEILKYVEWHKILIWKDAIKNVIEHNKKVGVIFEEKKEDSVLSNYKLLEEIMNKNIDTMKNVIEYLEDKKEFKIIECIAKNNPHIFIYVKDLERAFNLIKSYPFLNLRKHRKKRVLKMYLYKFINYKREEILEEILSSEITLKKSYLEELSDLCEINILSAEKNKEDLDMTEDKKEYFRELAQELLNKISFINIDESFKEFEDYILIRKNIRNF